MYESIYGLYISMCSLNKFLYSISILYYIFYYTIFKNSNLFTKILIGYIDW